MRLSIDYSSATVDIVPADIAQDLFINATDEQIADAVSKAIDVSISDGPWPSYRVIGKDDAIEAVREALAARQADRVPPSKRRAERRSRRSTTK